MTRLTNQKSNISCNKTGKSNTDKCKKIRNRLISALEKHFSPDTPWLQRHIERCPRCQKRLASLGRVNLALTFLKAKTHNLDLLMRANTQAIGVLKKSLREVPKAQKLKKMKPDLKLGQKLIQCLQPSTNLAACIMVLFLMKCGIFSSMNKVQSQSKKVYKNYFVSNIGEEMTEDIFPGDFT